VRPGHSPNDALVQERCCCCWLRKSARINNVSGATVTWEGYTSSLQKAIDTAQQQGIL